MLYVIWGNDIASTRNKFDTLIKTLLSKKEDSNIHRYNSINWNTEEVLGMVDSMDLFNDKHIVSFSNIFENVDAKDFFSENIEKLSASENIFILVEEVIEAPLLKKIEKFANKVQEINKKSFSDSKTAFNVFSITDAFGSRDRKKLWVLYQEALSFGLSSEEVFWKLCWQIKSMLIASDSDLKGSGLKPFPYRKAKDFLSNYEVKDLRNKFFELTKTYHDSRQGVVEFDIALEKFILEV